MDIINRNFLPALSMELLFPVDALRNDLMFPPIRFLILVFLKVVFIRDIMNQLVSKLVCLGVLCLNTPSTSNLNLHQNCWQVKIFSTHILKYNYLKIILSSKLYTNVVSYHSDNNTLPCSFMYDIETTVGDGCGALAQ